MVEEILGDSEASNRTPTPVRLRERAVKEGFWEEEVLSHATRFGQGNVSRSDLCQFQVEALRACTCFSVIPLFPLPQE